MDPELVEPFLPAYDTVCEKKGASSNPIKREVQYWTQKDKHCPEVASGLLNCVEQLAAVRWSPVSVKALGVITGSVEAVQEQLKE